MCFLTVLEPKTQKRGAGRATLSLKCPGENLLHAPFLKLLVFARHPCHSLACGRIPPVSASAFIRCSPRVSMSVALFSLLTRTPGIGLGPTLDTQYNLALKIDDFLIDDFCKDPISV